MARKISRLHPARRPSSPMKILRRVDVCLGGIVSAGVSVAWLSGDGTSVSLFRAWFKVSSRDWNIYESALENVPELSKLRRPEKFFCNLLGMAWLAAKSAAQ